MFKTVICNYVKFLSTKTTNKMNPSWYVLDNDGLHSQAVQRFTGVLYDMTQQLKHSQQQPEIMTRADFTGQHEITFKFPSSDDKKIYVGYITVQNKEPFVPVNPDEDASMDNYLRTMALKNAFNN